MRSSSLLRCRSVSPGCVRASTMAETSDMTVREKTDSTNIRSFFRNRLTSIF